MSLSPEKLTVLLVEEGVLLRRQIADLVSALPEVGQVLAVATAGMALMRLGQAPVDLALCDLEGEQEEGLKALRLIRARYPHIAVLGLGVLDARGAVKAVEALRLGALEVVAKPPERAGALQLAAFKTQLSGLLFGLKGRSAASLARRLSSQTAPPIPSRALGAPTANRPEPAPRTPAAVALSGVDVLAIGISTGGPNALRQVIPRLPANLGMPVLIVQHMPPSFTKALAESLDRESELTVKEAEDGETLQPGVAYIAPGGQHLAVRLDKNPAGDRVVAVINQDPPVNSCRPSVDVLLKSLPPVYGGRVLVAIMTGMGNDGAAGVAQIKAKGGYCLTQTEETCVVYGMPRAVDEAGLSDEKAPLDQIATRLIALARSSAERKPPA